MVALSKNTTPAGGAGSVRNLLRLAVSPGWGPTRIREGLERTGSVLALEAEAAAHGALDGWSRVEVILASCRAGDVRVTALDGADYPEELRHLPDPPPILYSRGDLSALHGPRVVIVGSRRATAYGRRVSETLAVEAARSGWIVVSGMAMGVDGAAHRGALEAGGRSVAVLGSGLDRPTPRAHAHLAERLRAQGCLLSELPPGVPARPHHFPRRNRILAALGTMIVVVEAARRSGALITARLGLELGREVWAVPSSVFSPVCEGSHLLLEDGARPVVTPARWREALGSEAPTAGVCRPPSDVVESWDAHARAVWAALEGGSRTLDELLADGALEGGEVLSTLTRLELDGWVRRAPGGAFERRAA